MSRISWLNEASSCRGVARNRSAVVRNVGTRLRAAVEGELEWLSAEEKREWLVAVRGVSLVSDGFIPFRDNIDHAQRHGVGFVAQPGGSARDEEINAACKEYGITMVHTGVRAFHH